MLNELEKKVISRIQGDLPDGTTPFAEAAARIGISEEKFLAVVHHLKEQGVIRRFGATLRHQEAGYPSNAMVAWDVPDDEISAVGKEISRFREVTHCYERRRHAAWHYNLYSMIHGTSRDHCQRIAKKLAETVGINKYLVLFSEKEFKKTSMQYF
ncbi:MAG TPA: Lrp/AsnC family transcriptional regulator [Desulfobacteraceae bacterium]|nr:Lrp/AsnC family transcriptional regulator [Desulfobacteraceae bacterium]